MAKETTWTPEIIPQSDTLDLLIESQCNPGHFYAVDMGANNGNGLCTCEDYTMRIGPLRDKDVEPTKPHCKHILRAAEFIGFEFTKQVIKQIKAGKLQRDKNHASFIKSKLPKKKP